MHSAMLRHNELAPAKLNLALHVTGRRADGYHLLDSLVVFLDLADGIEASASDGGISVEDAPVEHPACSYGIASLRREDHLVWRAAVALRAALGIAAGAALRVTKRIPVGAGLGGGSADAAATLRVLCRLWKIEMDDTLLMRVALALGADVPACVHSAPLRFEGVGERMTLLAPNEEMRQWWLVLVHPGTALSTREVFSALDLACLPRTEIEMMADEKGCMPGIATIASCRNDLQDTAIALLPVIGEISALLSQQEQCVLARMSGSGAACFGVFLSSRAAQHAAGAICALRPEWWVRIARPVLQPLLNREMSM